MTSADMWPRASGKCGRRSSPPWIGRLAVNRQKSRLTSHEIIPSPLFSEGGSMLKNLLLSGALLIMCILPAASHAQAKTKLAIVGLDHDHVWGLLHDIAGEPNAELIAIADSHPELVQKAKAQVPSTVKLYSNYVTMLDEAKPEAVIVTTENDRHLEILRECAKRHIHYSTEKPMATNARDAREMERLANDARIKLMVNY